MQGRQGVPGVELSCAAVAQHDPQGPAPRHVLARAQPLW